MYDEINIISKVDIDYLQTYFKYDNTILFVGNDASECKKKYVIHPSQDELELYRLFDISVEEINKLI